MGSTRVTVDTTGAIVSARDYYAFGQTSRELITGNANRRYQYTGKERDVETNWDYFGARYYTSKFGVWLSVDPLADKYPGVSPYNYCMNNPLNAVDPDGREWYEITEEYLTTEKYKNSEGKTKTRTVKKQRNVWKWQCCPKEKGDFTQRIKIKIKMHNSDRV